MDQASLNVRLTAEGVLQTAVQPQGDGVHGKIPTGQVGLQAGDELHIVWATAVGVGTLGAVGGNFVGLILRQYGDGAVLQPGLNDPVAGEAGLRLLRTGRGTDIPVMGLHAPEQISDAAAHKVGLIAGVVEGLEDVPRSGGNVKCHPVSPFR